MTEIAYKAQARRLADHLSRVHGVKLKHASLLEAIAALHGQANWNTLLAAHPAGTPASSASAKADAHLLDACLGQLVARCSTGMRIEPSGDSFTVYVQRDGAYEHWAAPAVEVQALVAALWRRAGLPDSLDAAVPAGQFQWRGAGADWQMQVFPMNGGAARPGLLVRWRDPAAPVMPLERLGLTRLAEWRRGISLPQGLCLVAGTTGSGSSTTLEASAHYLRQQGRAVWDCRPEREAGAAREAHAVPGAVPDAVVLFGEIRDAQAAREAARLAEGRLVLASVHASSLSRAMARLVSDLDLPVTVLGHVLQVALAQTLLRRTCSQCAAGPDSARAQCASCRGTGYAGRVMVSECVQADGRNLLVQLHRLEGQGHSMLDDAVEKCREGLTDVAELTRIFGAEAPQRMAAPAG